MSDSCQHLVELRVFRKFVVYPEVGLGSFIALVCVPALVGFHDAADSERWVAQSFVQKTTSLGTPCTLGAILGPDLGSLSMVSNVSDTNRTRLPSLRIGCARLVLSMVGLFLAVPFDFSGLCLVALGCVLLSLRSVRTVVPERIRIGVVRLGLRLPLVVACAG